MPTDTTMNTCKHCGKGTGNAHFCSRRCYRAGMPALRRERFPPRKHPERNCEQCGEVIANPLNKRFCNAGCMAVAQQFHDTSPTGAPVRGLARVPNLSLSRTLRVNWNRCGLPHMTYYSWSRRASPRGEHTPISYVYALIDPFSNSVCYVGKTMDPGSRLTGHVAEARKGVDRPVSSWVRQILRDGSRPRMLALAITPQGNPTLERERAEIRRHLDAGCRLRNVVHAEPQPQTVLVYTRRPSFQGWQPWRVHPTVRKIAA